MKRPVIEVATKTKKRRVDPATSDCTNEIRAMGAEMMGPPHEYPPNDGGVLYHYTDAHGLMGLVRDKVVWATEFHHLNDRTEMMGERIIVEELTRVITGVPEGVGKLLSEVRHVFHEHPPSSLYHICVASLSTQGDQLSQWRGYARDGFAVGIRMKDAGLPETLVPDSAVAVGLARCIYDELEFRRLVREVVGNSIAIVAKYIRDTRRSLNARQELWSNGVRCFLASLGVMAPRLKHEGFKEEDEYRVIALIDNRSLEKHQLMKLRVNASGRLVPYCEVPLMNEHGKLPLASVRLGPTHNVDQAKNAVSVLLELHGHDPGMIEPSRIPFSG